MKPNYTDRNVTTSGVASSGAFKISLTHSAHIMKILRDQLYSDKKLAVLREYSANAWDANREAGNGDKPIKVTLPTVMEPTLSIRDYGPGISDEDIYKVYAQYGESTKRNSDGQVGMLGIGSKSGFAYTDSFTVTTWQNGTQRIYTALLDNGDAGSMNLLDESESDEPQGTMIQIPVRPNDIPEFLERAHKLYVHFKPRPIINTNLEPEVAPEVSLQNGTISKGRSDWYAVMGCIAYPISMDQLRGLNAHKGGAGGFLDRLNGYLYFSIGDIEIAASREGLEYSDKTKAKLIDKFNDLVDEFVKQTLDNIENGDFSIWEKRIRAQVLNEMHLPVPKLMTLLIDERVNLGDPKTFTITFGQKQTAVSSIHVNSTTRLVMRDEIRRIDGYGLTAFDYVVRPKKDIMPIPTLADVRTELEAIIDEKNVKGIPIINISTIQWHQKAKFSIAPTKTTNRKHTVKTFVLKGDDKHFSIPFSDHWEIETITPTEEDVYVLIRKFKVLEGPDDDDPDDAFYAQFSRDRSIATVFGMKMPKVYGYKSTVKEPTDVSKIKGKQYSAWRVEFLDAMTRDPRVRELYDSVRWLALVIDMNDRYYDLDDLDQKVIGGLIKGLGSDHRISKLLRKVMASKRLFERTPEDVLKVVRRLCKTIDELRTANEPTTQETEFEEIEKSYPMLEVVGTGLKALMSDDSHLDKWIDYIKLVDRAMKGLNNEQSTVTHSNGRVDHNRLEGQSTRSEEGGAQLQQSEEGDSQREGGRRLVEDRGPSVGGSDSEGMVERQVRPERGLSDLLRAASA